jgi:Uma2 family endonuclease
MSSVAKKHQAHFTVDDYLAWTGEERWELIAGVAYNMSPAPSIKHQDIAGRLYHELAQRLKSRTCKPFIAPVDVVLSAEDVVQPDVLVVCDPNKITQNNIQVAPDLVVEVLSPGTALKDLREKKQLYERSGVAEYVVIDPLEDYVQRFYLQANGSYHAGDIFGIYEELPLLSLLDVVLPLWEIFDVELPQVEKPII